MDTDILILIFGFFACVAMFLIFIVLPIALIVRLLRRPKKQ